MFRGMPMNPQDGRATSRAGALRRMLSDDHARLDALLTRAVADPARFDEAAFAEFRRGLLRHIAIEEKVLLPDARRRREGVALEYAARLRVDHGALASLLVPTPDAALVGEIRSILREHDPIEEGPGGLYETCEALAGDELDALIARARAVPEVPAARHFDGQGVHRLAATALEASARSHAKTARDRS